MKGQAFVVFPNVELATKALQVAHGVVLEDKPLVVTFRRKSAAAE